MANVLRIHPDDNVAVALQDLPQGTPLSFTEDGHDLRVCTTQFVPFGHKVALRDLVLGVEVVKYGAPIGLASALISAGQHVHVHNLRSVRGAANP